jgi:hypothetical protein
MDWYFAGRLIGAVIWPAVAGGLVYGVGWAVAAMRAPQHAEGIRFWSRVAALAAFAAILLMTGSDFLAYSNRL